MRTERRQLSVLDLDGLVEICGAAATRRGPADRRHAPGEHAPGLSDAREPTSSRGHSGQANREHAAAQEHGWGSGQEGHGGGTQERNPVSPWDVAAALSGQSFDSIFKSSLTCSIFVTDVAGFGDPARNDIDRLAVRQGFYGILRSVFDESGAPWADCYHEDRGDGVVIVVPPMIAVARVVDPLLAKLADRLKQHNRHASDAARIQMRAALHVGPVGRDAEGLSGQAVIVAARILDAQTLKDKLRDADADLIFAASTYVYEHVIRHLEQVDPASYERVDCRVKKSDVTAWIHLAGSTAQQRPTPLRPGDTAGHRSADSHRARQPVARGGPATEPSGRLLAADTLPVAAPFGQLPTEVRGRDGLLAELRRPLYRVLRRSGRTWVIAGMGGLGKSTVALAVARTAKARGWRVWWVTAADTATLTGGMLEVLGWLWRAGSGDGAGAGGCADRARACVGVPQRCAFGG